MNAAALIVAAGRGTRAGGGLPKQYREIGGEAILARTVRRFLAAPSIGRVMVVIHPDDGALAAAALGDLPAETAHGGATRAASVRLGLEALAASPPDRVLIHDAARPFVSPAVIETITRALDRAPGACAAIPIVDALRRAENDCCGALIPREGAWRAQTPQGFRFADILSAHRAAADDDAPDDAEIARAAGLDVLLIESEADNFKITTPADFDRAGRLLAMSAPVEETRIGSGYDVHAFGPGDQVILCGVAVPHDRALVGHSDADVGLHAITDALLGALGLGDIGRWFPPSDPQWKGADSAIFLEAAVAEMARSGGRIVNLDVTLICERPKIGAHAGAMTARVAEICGIEQRRVNVKATTSERLGFTGREEGIAAMASASIAVRAQ